MKIFKIITLFVIVALVVICLSSAKKSPTTIFIIGDSTAANKSLKDDNLERGWGMVLQCYFDDDIIVDNHAVNGRSSKSFIDEGRWDVVVEKIQPGDYVFIQFGHNDEKPKADRHTDPGSTFDANLKKFVDETREKGGIPVLFNAVVRRNFLKEAPQNDDDEALRNTTGPTTVEADNEGEVLVDTHGDYRVAPKNVAKAEGVTFIDANKITHDLEQGLGREGSKKLHMWFMPGEEPSVPKGRQDNTHYNVYGAHVVAKLLTEAIAKQIPALEKHVVNYDIAVATDGKGDYFNLQDAVDNTPDNEKVTIQLFAGEWEKPVIPKTKKIKFKLREGASWK